MVGAVCPYASKIMRSKRLIFVCLAPFQDTHCIVAYMERQELFFFFMFVFGLTCLYSIGSSLVQ